MVKWISMAGKVVAGIGIFFGFYYLGDDPQRSLGLVTATSVGVVGVLAWVCHFIFHKQDAARLGWETDRPDWMWEVGFANLAFGVMGVLAVLADWGTHAQALVLIGYSLYLFQAALLHTYRYLTDAKRSPARLWRGVVPTLLLVGMMVFFAIYVLVVGGGTGSGSARDGASTTTVTSGSTAGTSPAGGSPAANVVQAAPVQHVKVGDISVGYRVTGPLAGTDGGAPASAAASPVAALPAAGAQTPLLLIMGSSGTMDLWSPALVTALAQDRQVTVFDNRGIGETDDPIGAYPFTQLADDTAGLIKALGYDKMDVLGWSMGGDIALDLAVRHPEVVGRLVSYAGDAGGSLALPPTPEAMAALMDTSGSAQQHGERLIALLFPQTYRSAHPEYAQSFPIPTEQMSASAIGIQNKAIGEWAGVWDDLKNITSPTLFVTGTEDVLTPQENALMMATRVPTSWLARFAGAGHGLMYQDPQGLADSVLLFFKETATR